MKTTAEWKMKPSLGAACMIVDDDDNHVATVERKHLALLMSAPELLERCKEAAEAIEVYGTNEAGELSMAFGRMLSDLHKTIEKAETKL